MTFNNRANKCTTIGAFQVTSFISRLLATDTSTDILKTFLLHMYHLQPHATSSSRTIMQLAWSNLTVLHAALLQTASTDFPPVTLNDRLVHDRKRFNVTLHRKGQYNAFQQQGPS